jgi:hypothetical protein
MKDLHIIELLKGVNRGSLDYFCNTFYDSGIYDRPDTGGSELIRNARFHDAPDAGENGVGIAVPLNEFRIIDRVGLDIHGHIVNQAPPDERLDDLGPAAVRIQLHRIAEVFDLFAKENEVAVQGGFAAGNHDTVEKSLPRFKEAKELRFVPTGRT